MPIGEQTPTGGPREFTVQVKAHKPPIHRLGLFFRCPICGGTHP